ncbi:hypothetical protein J3R82DRAFT_8739 [Butyriboletus roseoflavus]|nr:hypothetical protein J3R82DRAFT_8739 [Butyriboletus roseoflavus]
MSQPDPCSVVRIAIALAALKHKPRDRSAASYLLDLQSRFPVASKDNDGREWRTYALELEEQLANLKAQRDADQELLSKLRTDASQVASTSDAPPPKKKSKKNPTRDQHDPEWSWDQSRADWSRFLSSQYPSSPSLIAAYASLKGALASPNADLLSYASRVTDAILRTLDTIHLFLFSAPSLDPTQSALGAPLQLKPAHIDTTRIALASPLLTYVFRTALHTLVRTAQESTKLKRQRQRLHTTTFASPNAHVHVDRVLDHLLECVLLALLRALVPLCSARLAPLLSLSLKQDKVGRSSVGKGKDKDKGACAAPVDPPKTSDVRTDVFALIGTSLEALDALPSLVRPPGPGPGASGGGGSIAGGIRHRLGLETIRELEALYAVPPPPSSCFLSPPQPPATPSEPPAPTPAPLPTPTPTPTPLSAPSQTQTRSQPQPLTQQRAVPESRAKRLERLAGTRAERVRVLATRDAGWFLASTLSLCVTPSGGRDTSRDPAAERADNVGGTLLREALLDRIGKLVRSVPLSGRVSGSSQGQTEQSSSNALDGDQVHRNAIDFKLAIDPVCQNMLLAICERAMSQLASP